MGQSFLGMVLLAIVVLIIAVLLLVAVAYLAPLTVFGGIVGGVVGAIVGFLSSGNLLVTAGIGAALGSLLFTVLSLDGGLVDKGPVTGAVLGGLAGVFLTSDPVFPALAAVAGACAGTAFPSTDRLEYQEPDQPSGTEPDTSPDEPVRGIE